MMKTAVPKEFTPPKRSRARLYPASIAMTRETEVETTLMMKRFFIRAAVDGRPAGQRQVSDL